MASMRHRVTWRMAAGVAAAVLVAGCGSSGSKQASGPAGKASSGTSAGSTTSTTAPAGVGSTQTVTGPNGAAATVKLASVVDPATPANSYDQVAGGNKYVGVQLVLTDTATAAFTTSIIQDTHIVDSAGVTVTPIVIDMANCPVVVFGGTLALQPNAPFTGCVNFEIPTTATVSSVVLSLGPGNAGEATWKNVPAG